MKQTPEEELIATARAEVGDDPEAQVRWLAVVAVAAACQVPSGLVRARPVTQGRPAKPAPQTTDGTEV